MAGPSSAPDSRQPSTRGPSRKTRSNTPGLATELHWANVTAPLKVLDWEGWGRAPEGFDGATLYAYSLLQPDTAARVRAAFPVLGSPAGLAAEATVCAQLLQTVARGDNLVLKDQLRHWADEIRHR